MVFQTLTFNLASTEFRTEAMEGTDYIVLPMVMLTEGVHNGSEGALFYGALELAKTPSIWNGRPIVVYHPTMNGVAISAGDPVIFDKQKVGFVMNTVWDGKLRAEAWIDPAKADIVDPRIMEMVNNKQQMEVSTGVFTDKTGEAGEWNGEQFVANAINFRPDHLALLPDQVGACSLEDGAGLMVSNALSNDNVYSQLSKALRERFGSDTWVWDVYPDFVVYEREGVSGLERLSYTQGEMEVTLSNGEPSAVMQVTEYRTVDGAFVGNSSGRTIDKSPSGETEMGKKEIVDGLIANTSTQWAETDRAFLMEQTEDQLAKFAPVANEDADDGKGTPNQTGETIPGGEGTQTETDTEPTGNQATSTPVTMDQYLAAAPAGLRGPLQQMVANHNQQHAAAVQRIVANTNNTFTPEELGAKPIDELLKLEKLMGGTNTPGAVPGNQPIANYAGAATPTGNANGQAQAVEALPLPTVNWGSEDSDS